MPNTKAVGVAYSDPQFDSVNVSGASALAGVGWSIYDKKQ